MSSLAPFVAAAIKDKTICDLMKEIDELRDERLAIQITGPNGSPIHYKGSLKDGHNSNNGTTWTVDFKQQMNKQCDALQKYSMVLPLDSAEKLEIWFGGIVVQRFGIGDKIKGYIDYCQEDDFDLDDFDLDNIEEPQMGGITFHIPNGLVCLIKARLGPILYDDYKELPSMFRIRDRFDEILEESLGPKVNRYLYVRELTRIHRIGHAQDFVINSLVFDKSERSGSIFSLLEKMGISTAVASVEEEEAA